MLATDEELLAVCSFVLLKLLDVMHVRIFGKGLRDLVLDPSQLRLQFVPVSLDLLIILCKLDPLSLMIHQRFRHEPHAGLCRQRVNLATHDRTPSVQVHKRRAATSSPLMYTKASFMVVKLPP